MNDRRCPACRSALTPLNTGHLFCDKCKKKYRLRKQGSQISPPPRTGSARAKGKSKKTDSKTFSVALLAAIGGSIVFVLVVTAFVILFLQTRSSVSDVKKTKTSGSQPDSTQDEPNFKPGFEGSNLRVGSKGRRTPLAKKFAEYADPQVNVSREKEIVYKYKLKPATASLNWSETTKRIIRTTNNVAQDQNKQKPWLNESEEDRFWQIKIDNQKQNEYQIHKDIVLDKLRVKYVDDIYMSIDPLLASRNGPFALKGDEWELRKSPTYRKNSGFKLNPIAGFHLIDLRTAKPVGKYSKRIQMHPDRFRTLSPNGEWFVGQTSAPKYVTDRETGLEIWKKDRLDAPEGAIKYSGKLAWLQFCSDNEVALLTLQSRPDSRNSKQASWVFEIWNVIDRKKKRTIKLGNVEITESIGEEFAIPLGTCKGRLGSSGVAVFLVPQKLDKNTVHSYSIIALDLRTGKKSGEFSQAHAPVDYCHSINGTYLIFAYQTEKTVDLVFREAATGKIKESVVVPTKDFKLEKIASGTSQPMSVILSGTKIATSTRNGRKQSFEESVDFTSIYVKVDGGVATMEIPRVVKWMPTGLILIRSTRTTVTQQRTYPRDWISAIEPPKEIEKLVAPKKITYTPPNEILKKTRRPDGITKLTDPPAGWTPIKKESQNPTANEWPDFQTLFFVRAPRTSVARVSQCTRLKLVYRRLPNQFPKPEIHWEKEIDLALRKATVMIDNELTYDPDRPIDMSRLRFARTSDGKKLALTSTRTNHAQVNVYEFNGKFERSGAFVAYDLKTPVEGACWIDTSHLITLGNGCITKWNVDNLTAEFELQGDYREPILGSPSGKLVVVSRGRSVDIVDTNSGSCIARIRNKALQSINSISISPDQQFLAIEGTCEIGNSRVMVYRLSDGAWLEVPVLFQFSKPDKNNVRHFLPVKGPLLVGWHKTGRLIVSAGSHMVYDFDNHSIKNLTVRELDNLEVTRYALEEIKKKPLTVRIGYPDRDTSKLIAIRLAAYMAQEGYTIGTGGNTLTVTASHEMNRNLKSNSPNALVINGKSVPVPQVVYHLEFTDAKGKALYEYEKIGMFPGRQSRYYKGRKEKGVWIVDRWEFRGDMKTAIINEILERGIGIAPVRNNEIPKARSKPVIKQVQYAFQWNPAE